MKQLDKLLDESVKAELRLEPPSPPVEEEFFAPTLKGFADLLLSRLPVSSWSEERRKERASSWL